MSRVSPQSVKKEIFLKMMDEFINHIINVKTGFESKQFLNKFLTSSEKIMLAKRLALILMLKRGYSFSTIKRNLKISDSTIARFWKLFKRHKFDFIRAGNLKGKKAQSFWETLEKIINAGMPPRGRGHWRNVYRMLGPS